MVEYIPTVISLFAGCGGSSLGYKLAGYKELLAIDFNKTALKTFKKNFKDIPICNKDISQLSAKQILEFCGIRKGCLDVLDGSPPCQGFSIAGKRLVCDGRNNLVNDYIRLVADIQPRVFVMENVPGMVQGKSKGLFKEYYKSMKAVGYNVSCRVLDTKWFSVPQARKRLICIGVRNNINKVPVFPTPTNNIITVREAFKNIVNKTYIPVSPATQCEMRKVPQGRKASYIRRDKMHFSFFRLHNDKPSPTLTKIQAGTFHPTKHRNLTIEELKRLQSFPDNFIFIGSVTSQVAQIGNSVPPLFMKKIAETILSKILNK